MSAPAEVIKPSKLTAEAFTPSELQELSAIRRLARSGKARRLRVEAELSQAEVARAIGVSSATLCRWETGRDRPQGRAGIMWGRLLRSLSGETKVAL